MPVLVVSTTGARESLSQPILVGRSPSVSKVSAGQIPKLITITGNDQDISRNHVQFAVEGGTVVVTDLHSKNGTSIVLPGKDPQKLRAGEPTAVIVGTVIDLGSGITLTVDDDA
jgi:pSer/pThr/pTyr-binding forkhead associated (FHA) protein